jgi:hypothetical protein
MTLFEVSTPGRGFRVEDWAQVAMGVPDGQDDT